MNGEGGNMFRFDSSQPADRDPVLMQGLAAAVNTPDGAGASLRAADDAALRSAAKSEAVKLDLYHLVLIFAVCSVLGLIGETVVSYFVDGRWEDRAGFLWGPFSPIYGVGGVLMTLALARLADARGGVLFGVAAVVGAAFEWFAGWFWENAFGIVAWDYSSQPFNLGGHTCLGIALVWGAAGVAWVKLALPAMQRAADAVPVSWRAPLAWGLLVFFLVDAVVTFAAFDCWMNRLAGAEPADAVQRFFAAHYGNDVMANRFQTMSMYPCLAGFRG